eukprot:1433979-Rhodomonas_salina.1
MILLVRYYAATHARRVVRLKSILRRYNAHYGTLTQTMILRPDYAHSPIILRRSYAHSGTDLKCTGLPGRDHAGRVLGTV